MAISTMDHVVAGLAVSQDISLFWPASTAAVGSTLSLNRLANNAQGQAAVATVRTSGGHIPTDVPPGFPTIVDAASGKTLYLARIALVSTAVCTVSVYDRIWAASGFSGVVTTAQTVTTPPALPASRVGPVGEGCEIWLESISPIGSGTTTVSVSYTNQSGVAGRIAAETTIASFPVNRLQRIRLADGDTGVRAIESVTLAATTGTAGDFAVLLLERKCMISLPIANVGAVLDFAGTGMPVVDNSAALMFVHQSTTTTTGTIMGSLNLIAG